MPAGDRDDPTTTNAVSRHGNRRRRIVAGTTGAALALAGLGYLLTGPSENGQRTAWVPPPGTPVAVAPAAPSGPTAVSAPAPAPVVGSPGAGETTTEAAGTGSAAQAGQPAADEASTDSGRKSDVATREAPLAEQPVIATTERAGDVTVNLTSADYDLTGLGHLRWAGDAGKAVGEARCTRRFRFDPSGKAETKPDILMCWRATSTKSVVAMAFGQRGARPSTAGTVQSLNRQWEKLG